MRLEGKVAIVTGAAHGIGQAIAKRYAAEGAIVAVNDVNVDGTHETVQAIEAAGGQAVAAIADVTSKEQVDGMVDMVLEKFGRIDILVNNAALIKPTYHMLDPRADENWWRMFIEVNLTGAYICSRRVAHWMARNGGGNIINMSSGGGSRAHRGFTSYDAAKGGIEALTRAMALDLGPYGIRVNTLVPGSINTYDMDEETLQYRGENIPLGRVGRSDEMAGPAVFLATDDASYITGHIIAVDGGMLIQQRSATVDIFPLRDFPELN
ncbi:MAG: glucose 1-dehydrogenase [Chloroflexota bacterium]